VLSNVDHIDLRLMKRGLVNILYGQQTDVGKPISLVLAAYSIRRDAVNGLGFQLFPFISQIFIRCINQDLNYFDSPL